MPLPLVSTIRSRARGIISFVIVSVITLQVIAMFDPKIWIVWGTPFFWPFMDYPMYRVANYEGDVIDMYEVVALFDDGSEAVVDRKKLGLDFWLFRWDVVYGVLDEKYDKLAVQMDVYEQVHGVRPAALRVVNHPHILRRDGLEQGDPVVVKEIRLDGPMEADS